MATPSTVATWTLNGTTTEFDVPFDYLSRTYVKVTLIGATPTVLVLGTDFQFITPTRIQTFRAYGPPDFQLIEVRRETSTTERLVEFHDASILTASDMNTADLQVLHVAEEARNAATESIGVNNDGHLDARGRRIVNLAAPQEPLDAVTKQYVDDKEGGVGQALGAAEAARDKAKEWATKATPVETGLESSKTYSERSGASAGASAASAGASQTSAQNSSASAQAASASAGSALNQANIAEGHKNAAGASAGSAASSASLAGDWSSKPYGSQVVSGKYSAMHWATVSKEWADAAASGVLPKGSVKWEVLDNDLQSNRWLSLGGGHVNGSVTAAGHIGLTAGTNGFSNALYFGGTAASGLTDTHIIRTPEGALTFVAGSGWGMMLHRTGDIGVRGHVWGVGGTRRCAYVDEVPSAYTPPAYARTAGRHYNDVLYTNSKKHVMYVTATSGTSSAHADVTIFVAGRLTAQGHFGFGGFTGPMTINAAVGPGETWSVGGAMAISTLEPNW